MNRETALTATVAFNSPVIVLQRLPEDASQALIYVTSILGVNDDAEIQPGDLYGMSLILANARNTWRDMRGGGPSAFLPFAFGELDRERALPARKIRLPRLGHRLARGVA